MTQQAMQRNPFMLMISPEVVLAAVAGSERLSQLNRHLCRPLDRPSGVAGNETNGSQDDGVDGLDGDEGAEPG